NIKYEAISYTWGDTSHLKSIFLGNSHDFQVTHNCNDVLRRFRKPDGKRLIWIDAICINQKDDEERIRQIRRMGEIYENASQVLVYLGEADDSSTRVFRHIMEHYLPSNVISPTDSTLVEAKSKLICRPWFSRVWVFYGVGSTTVVCGTEALFWDQLASFYIPPRQSALPEYSRDTPYVFLIGSWSEDTDLFRLLCQTRYADATDPRDKYFGIMSMVRDDYDSELIASYSQNTTRVYTEIGLHLLKHYGLQVLRAIRHPHSRHPTLASWIPDWSRRDDNDTYWLDDFTVRAEYECIVDHRILDCYRDGESDHSSHPVLLVTGFRVGQIKSLRAVLAFEDPSHSCLDALRRIWNSHRGRNGLSSSRFHGQV
ncbi:heterokaryon incompatibility protein-domain-containing protein, partial [Hyaloscypha finlandica]